MRLKNAIVFLLIMVLIGSSCPLAVLAQSQEIKTAEINQTVTDISGNASASMAIQSLDEIGPISRSSAIDSEIIVIYEDQASVGDLSLTTQEIKGGETLNDRVDIIEVADSVNVDSLVTELSENPNVLVAEKNSYIQTSAIPNDPLLSSAWQFERIGENNTWDQVNNSDPVVVAVIDSGLNTQHPDIIGNTVNGYDYVESTANVVDLAGHGTMVSGCIAATTNNNIGFAGVAGTANIKIAPYRVGGLENDDPYLNVGYICAALYDAAGRSDVKVINMSFGGYMVSQALQTAVAGAASKGKVLVTASGNEGNDPNYGGAYSIPASYNNVISVGATTNTNVIASFSQHNSQLDLCAPGQDILTINHDGGYELASGTSFASPITAGACAVLLATDPSLTSTEVETILKDTALDFGTPGKDDYYGYGMIQLNAALAAIKNSGDTSINYRTHVQNVGWQNFMANGTLSGTTGKSLRLEAIEINTDAANYDIGVKYKTHVQNIGWQDFVTNGTLSGTMGKSLRLEAIQIELTGGDAGLFDIYYQVHAQNVGWMGWAKNGNSAGTEGLSYRLEGIRIEIVPKDSAAPGPTEHPFIKN